MDLKAKMRGMFGRSHHKKRLVKEPREALKARYLLELKNVEASLKYDAREVVSVRVFSLVKDFFCELLEDRSCDTLEELAKRLKYKRIDPVLKKHMVFFLGALVPLEYGDKHITEKQLKSTLEEFKSLIQSV